MPPTPKVKEQFNVVDIRGTQLSIVTVSGHPDKIFKLIDKNSVVGMNMSKLTLQKLQSYLNRLYPVKIKASRLNSLQGTIRKKDLCESGIVMYDNICKRVCKEMNIAVDEIAGVRRLRRIVYARSIICYLVRKHTKLSYTDLCGLMLKTHPTTLTLERRYLRDKGIVKYSGVLLSEIAYKVEEFLGIRRVEDES